MLVHNDGSTTHFCSSKCENNADLGREARNLGWTDAGRATTATQQQAADEATEAEATVDEAAAEDEAAAAEETDADDAETEDAGMWNQVIADNFEGFFNSNRYHLTYGTIQANPDNPKEGANVVRR